jgi:hypothetical protein
MEGNFYGPSDVKNTTLDGVEQSVYWLGYGLDNRGSIADSGRSFSLRHHVQTASGTHPVSYLMNTGGFYHRGKVAGEWSWPSTFI